MEWHIPQRDNYWQQLLKMDSIAHNLTLTQNGKQNSLLDSQFNGAFALHLFRSVFSLRKFSLKNCLCSFTHIKR